MTSLILIANAVSFVLQSYILPKEFVSHYLTLRVDGLKHGLIYELITFQFLHGGWWHLIGNSLVIFFFGRIVEDRLGTKNFLTVYFLGGVLGGLLQVVLTLLFPGLPKGGVMGASAGAFALVAAFATQTPEETVLFFFVPLPAKFILFIEGGATLVGLVAQEQGIAHGAHLGGMFTGILFIKWLGRSPKAVVVWRPFRRYREKRELAKVTPQRQPWKPKIVERELPPEEFMSQEVDPILDKISAHGIQSLTDRERQILEAARKKMARK